MTPLCRFIGALIALIILVFLIFLFWLFSLPVIVNKDFRYELKSGTTAKQLAVDLHKKAHLIHPMFLRILVRLRGDDNELQAGEYMFPQGSSINEILNQITSGDIVQYQFMIVNGWNLNQVKVQLKKASGLKHTINKLTDRTIAKKLQIHQSTSEGFLYPDTYHYHLYAKDIDVLYKARKKMKRILNDAWKNRAPGLWYKTPYQALIVASMIEKEASVSKEKPVIAGVILKRLKRRIHLQIDSTVIYGLGKQFHGNLTWRDLRHNTPYNTYVNYGLPPTPICMPSQSSIEAALHPKKTHYLYFVSKGDGSHIFSSTLKEQNRAIAKYQLRRH